ncbi:hypothetical protein DICPUDRAFT_156375 [Dictyostelium purpureum]|uniref:Fucosyltransferase n=1 Tax=Dictyostelium purpureum TaxID=5786 RepID=F0ZWE7_DICPU|nr:uncharacterized protein DICPUDRAFT_156375 [Dictyostelium purpureum]EGC31736.1 hypothetical protein DICPUDRAFT_156375 [Dictyostelium purpureum]|eukprot:XP_003291743.1 hypothetical protein DICPUDRAFT_156375 [Dictyostelium purpureum]
MKIKRMNFKNKKFKVLIIVIVMTFIIVLNYNTILNNSTIQSNNNKNNNNIKKNNKEKEYTLENDIDVLIENDKNNNNNLKEDNIKNNLNQLNIDHKNGGDLPLEKVHRKSAQDKIKPIKTKDKNLYDFLIEAKKLNVQVNIRKTNENWFDRVKNQLKIEKKVCHYSNHRNYNEKPVRVTRSLTVPKDNVKCDLPCKVVRYGDNIDASVYSRDNYCSKSIFETLENVKPFDRYDIVSTTSLDSDVILGYYAWHEYPYFKKPKAKVHNKDQGLVAAFISNCSPEYRLKYIDKLIEYGVKVDSYGSCRHNKNQPESSRDYNGAKLNIAESYKFIMAFENSETDDYVTEKFFGALACGTVPLYHGAPNGKKYFPRPNAAIFVNDFKSPKELADHLLYLDKNDKEYEKFFDYKKYGPTKEWMSIIDNSKVNDDCRTCIKVADLHRKQVGMVMNKNESMQLVPKSFKPDQGIVVYIREKSTFWFTSVAIPYNSTYLNIIEIISNSLPHKGEIYEAYDLSNKNILISNEKLKHSDKIELFQNQEIEVIFIDLNFFFNSKKLNLGEEIYESNHFYNQT